MKACPVEGAIKRDNELGTILIDDSRCSRCGECVNACPFKAIWYDQQNDKIIKCDLCGGEPQCIEWCPVSVLEFIKEERKMSRA
jgi:Fe-S-cluster-containing hydrogenase component 2